VNCDTAPEFYQLNEQIGQLEETNVTSKLYPFATYYLNFRQLSCNFTFTSRLGLSNMYNSVEFEFRLRQAKREKLQESSQYHNGSHSQRNTDQTATEIMKMDLTQALIIEM
jgi:hypothetical protein